MEYNSQKEILVIPEYGRHVQNMIEHAKTIEDKEYRQAFVERIIDLMYQMNPQNKNLNEYRDKLWKHVFKISKYSLDVMPPNGNIPTEAESRIRPETVEYPTQISKFRHYGQFVRSLVKKAIEMEDEEKKKEFTKIIATYMKMAYTTWNREHFVSDEIIKEDLVSMSKGALSLPDDVDLHIPQSYSNKKRRRNNFKGKGKDNHRHKGHKGKKRK